MAAIEPGWTGAAAAGTAVAAVTELLLRRPWPVRWTTPSPGTRRRPHRLCWPGCWSRARSPGRAQPLRRRRPRPWRRLHCGGAWSGWWSPEACVATAVDRAGNLLTRLLVDAEVAGSAGPALVAIGSGVVVSVGAIVALCAVEPLAAVVPAVAIALAVAATRSSVGRIAAGYGDYQRQLGVIAARLTDALAGARTIHACGNRGLETERVLAPLPEVSRVGFAVWRAQCALVWRTALLLAVVELAVVGLVGARVAGGSLTPGQFLAALAYLGLMLRLRGQLDVILSYPQVRAAGRRVRELLSAPLPPRGPLGVRLPDGPGALAFRGVSVRVANRLVLDGIDLDVAAGSCVAVVGASGVGKSVLAGLVGRLTEADAGEVRIDGASVIDVDVTELRAQVAYAFDRPVLRGATIRAAVAAGRPGAATAEITTALRIAGAEEFVRRLPGGLDTPLPAIRFSGGELQRLGLARAIAHGGRVLVLDDATSSLDTATEARVCDALTSRLAGRTRLLVAHRAATAARADLVAWLDSGRLRAVAPHAQLWAVDAEYRALFAETS